MTQPPAPAWTRLWALTLGFPSNRTRFRCCGLSRRIGAGISLPTLAHSHIPKQHKRDGRKVPGLVAVQVEIRLAFHGRSCRVIQDVKLPGALRIGAAHADGAILSHVFFLWLM